MWVVWQTGLSNINTTQQVVSMSSDISCSIKPIKCSFSLHEGPKSSGHLFKQGLADNHSTAVNLIRALHIMCSQENQKERTLWNWRRGESSFVISSIPHLCYHLITLTLLSLHNPHLCYHLINHTSVINSSLSPLLSPHHSHLCYHLITLTSAITS